MNEVRERDRRKKAKIRCNGMEEETTENGKIKEEENIPEKEKHKDKRNKPEKE
jgi:hypothetical protein